MFAEVSVRELTKRASADEATDVIVLNCLTRIGAQRGEYVVAVRVRIASRRRRDRLHFSPLGDRVWAAAKPVHPQARCHQ